MGNPPKSYPRLLVSSCNLFFHSPICSVCTLHVCLQVELLVFKYDLQENEAGEYPSSCAL